MSGTSIVLFRMKACLRYSSFAISKLDPRWSSPVIMKKMRATFFIFVSVCSMLGLIIAQWLLFVTSFCRLWGDFKLEFMLSEKEMRHVAKLARIELTDAEVGKFSGQLSGVLDYMDILKEVDTEGVEETNQVTGLKTVLGKDRVVSGRCKREELLKCSELPVDSDQIRVLPAIK